MKNLIKLSILVLAILFLFVGCKEDRSSSDAAGVFQIVLPDSPSTSVVVAPEPATLLLLGSGLIALAGYGRKKFFKK